MDQLDLRFHIHYSTVRSVLPRQVLMPPYIQGNENGAQIRMYLRSRLVTLLQRPPQFLGDRAQGFDARKIFIVGFHQRPGGIGGAGL